MFWHNRLKLLIFTLFLHKYYIFLNVVAENIGMGFDVQYSIYPTLSYGKLPVQSKTSVISMKDVLENIYKSGIKFLDSLTPKKTYKVIVDEARRLLDVEEASIFIDVNGKLERVYTSEPFFKKIKIRKNGYTYKSFKERKTFVLTITDAIRIHPELKGSKLKCNIFIPLSYKNKSIGVLLIESYTREVFSDEEIKTLKLFASFATLAIRKTQLYQETKEALEIRDVFIALASHELRTPLTTINGYVQLLNSKMQGKNTSEAKWMEHLSWECKRLTILVRELLEVNLIKAGKLQFALKECSLSEILERVKTDFAFRSPDRMLIVKDTLKRRNDIIIGDFDKLLQAFSNLVHNAAKFSDSDKEITLIAKEIDNDYLIEIIDKGHGIPKKDLPRISNEFYKAYGNLKEGFGLGLFSAKYFITSHKGKLYINSEENKGTTIQVVLPKANYEYS